MRNESEVDATAPVVSSEKEGSTGDQVSDHVTESDNVDSIAGEAGHCPNCEHRVSCTFYRFFLVVITPY